ncbi:KPN_02809 family neutral zinc metallopeptidase [Thiomonas bhubaneswarensis]|uniref:Predicted metalloprotease n=1 Tax=Thiomonas bhubaneswarensis TaxID=339866 RepID=A0A0K6IA99_9BURK|nr:neutral zinc metallopeptidase [Thiomonas bhubaneswarensis]CUB00041.1 Predicted metalloprotease [Thiomonas bhubaneswarensis]
MLWKNGRRSDNIEDQRTVGPARRGGLVSGGIGTIILALVALYFGVDPGVVLNQVAQQQTQQSAQHAPAELSAQDQQDKAFLSVVLADTEDTWRELFQQAGRQYVDPKLVLFSGAVQSACGYAQAATGPFYCPSDQKLYLDTQFFQELQQRLGARGDFAQAYVIAHEVGHHVQNLLGVEAKVREAMQRSSPQRANALLVRLELQADCYAGVWAYHAQHERQVLEPGDVEEAINAAQAVGDDRLQQRAQGYVVPDSFTHGTSAQRARWFETGFASGRPQVCDTFNAAQL